MRKNERKSRRRLPALLLAGALSLGFFSGSVQAEEPLTVVSETVPVVVTGCTYKLQKVDLIPV